ncbi:MAG: metal ABC transporter substrate-binding protein [Oscillospiraceae bacterium]|jgi:zinc transport system substrate-binding protein|nr:metal ABC transporter substrate-binding protein [Oscillospiraceae bacterium]
MKKYISIALALLLIIAIFAGCAAKSKPANNENTDKLSVVATIFAPFDFARQVAGDNADVTMLLPPASESHSFEPTPRDIITIQNADVFIYVGGESDDWVNNVLDSMDTSKMKIVTLMDCVEVVEEEVVEGMQEESGEPESEEPEYDEHVWTSPRNAKLIAQKLSDTFCAVDPTRADAYKANTAAYLAELDELDGKFRAVVDGATRKTLVFGDRFPFRYFADAYGLDYFAAFPGCSTETEASAATVAFLIDKVRAEQIPVVFHIELSNAKIADTLAEATGAKVLELHAAHNISKADFESGVTYLDIMTQNSDALREALN